MADEETFEVSHIVEEDYSNPNKRVFLIRWLGYTSENDSWEPLENLEPGAIEVVRKWDRKKKQLQRRKAKEDRVTVAPNSSRRRASPTSEDSHSDSSGRVKSSQMVIYIGLSLIYCRLSKGGALKRVLPRTAITALESKVLRRFRRMLRKHIHDTTYKLELHLAR